MAHAPLYSIISSLLPCLIPPYALRLNRIFGTQRVGWMLFTAFSLLAVVQFLHAWHPTNLGIDTDLTLDLLSFMVPILLLVGMVHLEMLFKERLRVEQEERRMRRELEAQVKARTADLDSANEELRHEIALRRQGEEELRKSKEQYRFLFDENPQPMWIVEQGSLRFLAFNSAALRHYGYTNEEFREMTVKDLCAPADRNSFSADCARTSLGPESRGLWRHCKKDGTPVEVQITALDLTYAGCPARLMLVNDLTAQRQLQKQLLQAQKREVTRQLAGGIADNFNQLITAIEGEAQVLAQKCQDRGAVEPLKRMAATAGCAAALNRQLLALVRRHPMQPQLLDLNKWIEEHKETLARLLGKIISLQTLCCCSPAPILADPALIQQILVNLLLNARDAMPTGGSLTLGTAIVQIDDAQTRPREEVGPGLFVCLSVIDTGWGMSTDVQSRLFEPFFTTKPPGKATGLGLATVHGLVKQHSGWIEVSSSPGAGSRFNLFFPVASSAGTARKAA